MKYLALAGTVASILMTFAACSSDKSDDDGAAGAAGSGGSETGGSSSGGSPSGGAPGSGGTAAGGMGGAPSCGPESLGGQAGEGGMSGEGGLGGGNAEDDLAIAGTYVDTYGVEYVITDQLLSNAYGGGYVQAYSNDDHYLVVQNAETNDYSPCLYSRYDWHEEDGKLYLCTSAFDAESVEDALDAPRADSSDLEEGCGGQFPWTELEEQ